MAAIFLRWDWNMEKQIGDGLLYLLNIVIEHPELNKKDILLEKISQFK